MPCLVGLSVRLALFSAGQWRRSESEGQGRGLGRGREEWREGKLCSGRNVWEKKKKEIIVTTNVWTSVYVVSFIIIYICPMFKSFSMFTTFFFKHWFSLHLSICVHTLAFTGTVCYSIWEWKNKFQKSVFFLSLCGFWRLNSGYQSCFCSLSLCRALCCHP